MPLFDFECKRCGNVEEKLVKSEEKDKLVFMCQKVHGHDHCDGVMVKVISKISYHIRMKE